MNKRMILLSLILLFTFIGTIIYFKKSINENKKKAEITKTEENFSTSNIIENVEYLSKDNKGNEYIVRAKEGEIDNSNNNIIFLNDVEALVNLNNSNKIFIFADYGKYNIGNFDTIFSKNVNIEYLDKKIKSGYLDFSILRNSMIISKNVIYSDLENMTHGDKLYIESRILGKSGINYPFRNDHPYHIISDKNT